MQRIQKIAPCLWFDSLAEETVVFYATLPTRNTQHQWV